MKHDYFVQMLLFVYLEYIWTLSVYPSTTWASGSSAFVYAMFRIGCWSFPRGGILYEANIAERSHTTDLVFFCAEDATWHQYHLGKDTCNHHRRSSQGILWRGNLLHQKRSQVLYKIYILYSIIKNSLSDCTSTCFFFWIHDYFIKHLKKTLVYVHLNWNFKEVRSSNFQS